VAANSIPTPELQLTTERKSDAIIVSGVGRISADTAVTLQNTVRNLIPDTKRIILDLTGVEYVDSSGLGALVSIYVAANNAHCMLELANPKQRVRDLFKMTKLASFFDGGACIGDVGGI
jgi:anti-sigma B factor antagonist